MGLKNGTRVFFWTSAGEIKYGTVQSTSRLADVSTIVNTRRNRLLKFVGDANRRRSTGRGRRSPQSAVSTLRSANTDA
ncbi:hypothetical protein JVT61DRAFT_11495 [Boletus reticuloceps]|uniref:Uncharacterized protein n=1 Tax=Boletus reticuloceps TaxID=495285 RepID=A0A8I2YTL8_9AGAM|nr:hypothetical protein JVT61DRAFT_11495 [Boletus reticuloceps]